MANYQNITPAKLGQAAIITTIATLYTVPTNTKTYLKQFDIVNTTTGAVTFSVHLVPAAGAAATTNAILYHAPLPAVTTLQWTGVEIMNTGDTIQIIASAVGCTITASGGEAI